MLALGILLIAYNNARLLVTEAEDTGVKHTGIAIIHARNSTVNKETSLKYYQRCTLRRDDDHYRPYAAYQ